MFIGQAFYVRKESAKIPLFGQIARRQGTLPQLSEQLPSTLKAHPLLGYRL